MRSVEVGKPDALFPLWEISFAVAYGVGVVLAWTVPYPGTSARVAATALLVTMALWWWTFGRRLALVDDTGPRGIGYLLGVLALFGPTALLVPDSSWVLFGLCVQPWMVRPHRSALRWVVALNVLPPLALLLRTDLGEYFWQQVWIAVGAVALSYVVGTNLHRISTQSEERAALIAELEDTRATVAALSREAGVTAERERLSAEIHDTLAQGFTSLLTLVQAARSAIGGDDDRARQHLDLAAETARENLAEARALVGALAPAALDTGSLAESLRRQAERVTGECGIAVDFETDGDLGQLSTRAQVVLLRAAQEALANVRRHSGARSAVVRLARGGLGVRLVVGDDGVGFDPAAPVEGFGLRGMRARVAQVGGSVVVDSGSTGTVLRVEVPV